MSQLPDVGVLPKTGCIRQPLIFQPAPRRRRHASNTPRVLLLSAEQRAQLDAWLIEGVTYEDCRARLLKRFSFSISRSALGTYFQQYIAPQLSPSEPQPLLDVTILHSGIPLRVRIESAAAEPTPMISIATIEQQIAALSLDDLAALNAPVRALLNGVSVSGHPRSGSKRLAQPSRVKIGQPRPLSKEEIYALPGMVGALRDYQVASGLTNAEFFRRFPILGGPDAWRCRLVGWQPKNFNHGRWYVRLKSICDALDAADPQWRCNKPAVVHPLTEFADLIRKLLALAAAEELSQRQLAKRIAVSWGTWRRLKEPEAPFVLDLAVWLPKLRAASQRVLKGEASNV